jgi:HAD superfamily hydrolase (TIGR01509 family)
VTQPTEAVVFDLDGVLIQSEEVWDEVRERYTRERGGRYDAEIQRAMMGMSSTEWSRFLHETAGISAAFPLAVASSSNRPLIDAVLDAAGLEAYFAATVSSEEVAHGKPAPDVYLEAARRLGAEATRCAAVEDSHGGIRSAKAAGMRVIAIPNATYPPDEEALAQADVVLRSLAELTPAVV